MRSLLLLGVQRKELSPNFSSASVVATTLDPAADALYALAEQQLPNGCVQLTLLRPSNGPSNADSQLAQIHSWDTETPSTLKLANQSTVAAFKYLPESDSICIILANGDIEQIFEPGHDGPAQKRRENVGSVDDGIKAAAWSPDDELLVLITGDDKLIEMTKDFEVLSEGPLRSAEFGEDAPVNVGWGEKSTQFHGSVGKSAAASAQSSSSTSSTTSSATHLKSSPDDDGLPRLSWRGDGAFFCVSSLDYLDSTASTYRRNLRIFSRVAALSSTSEATVGLEHSLSWQPTGAIIASTQKLIDSSKPDSEPVHHVVFFEKNGLRRYDFALREDLGMKDGVRRNSKVRSLDWNSDSTLLAVWIERFVPGGESQHFVQLWHRNNYHWYLKQELSPRLSGSDITSLFWHPEKALELYLSTTSGMESFELCWDVFSSNRAPPHDDGAVAVIDGSTLKLTPFRHANIPPPMCSVTSTSSLPFHTPSHVAFSANSTKYVVLHPNGVLDQWNWPLPASTATGKARSEVLPPTLLKSSSPFGSGIYAKQCACIDSNEGLVVAILVQEARGGSSVVVLRGDQEPVKVGVMDDVRRLIAGDDCFVLETSDGTILEVPLSADEDTIAEPSDTLTSLPEFCPWVSHINLPSSSSTIVGISSSGRLYSSSTLLASDATSFTYTDDFLIYTTFSHEAKFIPLFQLLNGGGADAVYHTEALKKAAVDTGIKRAVERGSKIVTVVPGSTSLVLQMPRGNLETVFPRPLVLKIVRQDLSQFRYRAAFLACRRHRIDLNVLYDHDPDAFRDHLAEFVSQIKEIDYLNLFLSGLKDEDVNVTMYRPLVASATPAPPTSTNKINLVCDLVRAELETRDVFHYANTILTTYVRKRPPDYESALKVLAELKSKDAARAEDAIKYIIFLSDADKLFDLALGMYDFGLVLMIAQHSQKDPKEYLPFLRDLRQLDTHVQRFKIDDHLERYSSALQNLSRAGPEKFDEAVEYMKKHGLFAVALSAFKNDPVKYKVILTANAEYLMVKHDYVEAGLLFSLAGQSAKAMFAYQKGNAWQELFTLAISDGKHSPTEIKSLAIAVAETLTSKRRYADAGRVMLEYGRDVEAAVAVLVEGTLHSEALRLIALYNRKDLIETHVKPGTLELQARLLDDCVELTEQVEKQSERLVDLKAKRDANPDQFFGLVDLSSAFENVDMQPDGASDAGTAFTRYTAAVTTMAGTVRSSQTSKSKRRAGLKKLSGKKGTIYEESYLLNSMKKAVEVRLLEIETEVSALLPILLSLNSTPQRNAAQALQATLNELLAFLDKELSTNWDWREAEWLAETRDEQDQRERGVWLEKGPVEEGTERVLRPAWPKKKWRVAILDSL